MGTLPRTGTVESTTSATPEQVWDLLADVTRTGDWSHETRGAEWLDGATGPVPGARFRGRNGKGRTRWSRICEIDVCESGRRIAWHTVPTRAYNDSTRWTYEIDAIETGTKITQRFEVLKLGPVMDRLFYAIIPAHRDRAEALRGDLEALGALAARAPVTP
jgi:hypothetical protein